MAILFDYEDFRMVYNLHETGDVLSATAMRHIWRNYRDSDDCTMRVADISRKFTEVFPDSVLHRFFEEHPEKYHCAQLVNGMVLVQFLD